MRDFLAVVGVIFIIAGLAMVIVGGGNDAEFRVPSRYHGPSDYSLDLTWLVTAILGVGMLCTAPVLFALVAILDSLAGGHGQPGPFSTGLPGRPLGPDGVTPKDEPDRGTAENRPAGPADV